MQPCAALCSPMQPYAAPRNIVHPIPAQPWEGKRGEGGSLAGEVGCNSWICAGYAPMAKKRCVQKAALWTPSQPYAAICSPLRPYGPMQHCAALCSQAQPGFATLRNPMQPYAALCNLGPNE